MPPLFSSHEIRILAGEPHSLIRVRNLQTTTVLTDAWGRPAKLQPVLISTSISLREPFETAAKEDAVDGSTIHYGILSKGILEAVQAWREGAGVWHLRAWVEQWLITGSEDEGRKPVLDTRRIRTLELKFMLPKASLLGSGVSVFTTTMFGTDGHIDHISAGLQLHDLRIPTLIGVNPNERLAKQIVVASVEIEKAMDGTYAQLEELVVKTIEESSFETLEALARHLGYRIILMGPLTIATLSEKSQVETGFPRLKICLEKPTAVTFADAPAVELLIDTDPKINGGTKALWKYRKDCGNLIQLPFPLQGRLDAWINENYPGGDPCTKI